MAKLISADLTNNKLCGKIVSHTYKIIFEKPITTVRVRAFYDCSNLTSITIGKAVI